MSELYSCGIRFKRVKNSISAFTLHTMVNTRELPDWAINRELGYPKVLATDFYDGRFANFGRINYVVFCLSLRLAKDLLTVILRMSDMVPESTFLFYGSDMPYVRKCKFHNM